MKTFLCTLALVCGAAVLRGEETAAEMENRVTALVASPSVTIVHLWAPWCSNCKAEMTPDGWAKFIRENPAVKVVFVSIWHQGQDPAPRLTAGSLGGQPNFVSLVHPNGARKSQERLRQFLGQPITWVPTTWVFKGGTLLYGLNYGEMRFPILQQLVRDASADW